MKSKETWLNGDKNQIRQNKIPTSFQYNETLVSTFLTKSYRDFEPDEELKLERALIRYNDEDINNRDGNQLHRSLFNNPCNLFIDFKYLTGYPTEVKATFYSEKVNLFSKLRLEYAEMFSIK